MTANTGAAAVIAAASYSYSITPGENAAGAFGYDSTSGTPGAISPTNQLKTVSIITIRSDSLSADIAVVIQGVRAQNFWQRIAVLATNGTWRSFNSSAATFSTPGGNSVWSFGTGSNRVWTATTPAPRGVIIFV
jgi:hypothetical protein